jgi:hypothetical protein
LSYYELEERFPGIHANWDELDGRDRSENESSDDDLYFDDASSEASSEALSFASCISSEDAVSTLSDFDEMDDATSTTSSDEGGCTLLLGSGAGLGGAIARPESRNDEYMDGLEPRYRCCDDGVS